MHLKKMSTLLSIGSILFAAPAFADVCDITTEKCWDGGKCNIKFKNHTGEGGGDAAGLELDQSSLAQTIKVQAVKDNGDSAGNTLSIAAGASNTMNIENKYEKNFDRIRIKSGTADKSVSMKCGDVKAVLRGNGNCNIIRGRSKDTDIDYTLAYSCDNGEVVGPY